MKTPRKLSPQLPDRALVALHDGKITADEFELLNDRAKEEATLRAYFESLPSPKIYSSPILQAMMERGELPFSK